MYYFCGPSTLLLHGSKCATAVPSSATIMTLSGDRVIVENFADSCQNAILVTINFIIHHNVEQDRVNNVQCLMENVSWKMENGKWKRL